MKPPATFAELVARLGLRERLAILALLVSLGMPWYYAAWQTNGTLLPGWPAPMSCVNVTSWDGWMSTDCTFGVGGLPMFIPGTSGFAPGTDNPGRFGVFAAILGIFAQAWTGERKHLWRGMAILLVLTVLTSGLGFRAAGSSISWIVIAVFLVAERPFLGRAFTRLRGG